MDKQYIILHMVRPRTVSSDGNTIKMNIKKESQVIDPAADGYCGLVCKNLFLTSENFRSQTVTTILTVS